MLASITPLGERGRHAHWAVTVSAFAIGATAVAIVLGALIGALGEVVAGGAVSPHARLALLRGLDRRRAAAVRAAIASLAVIAGLALVGLVS